jgi:hypothetical protein
MSSLASENDCSEGKRSVCELMAKFTCRDLDVGGNRRVGTRVVHMALGVVKREAIRIKWAASEASEFPFATSICSTSASPPCAISWAIASLSDGLMLRTSEAMSSTNSCLRDADRIQLQRTGCSMPATQPPQPVKKLTAAPSCGPLTSEQPERVPCGRTGRPLTRVGRGIGLRL